VSNQGGGHWRSRWVRYSDRLHSRPARSTGLEVVGLTRADPVQILQKDYAEYFRVVDGDPRVKMVYDDGRLPERNGYKNVM